MRATPTHMPNLARQTKNETSFPIGLLRTMENQCYLRVLNTKDTGLVVVNSQYLSQAQIASDRRRICAFHGIKKILRTLSAWDQVKLSLVDAPSNIWSNCAVVRLHNGQFIRRNAINWFHLTTTHHHSRLFWFRNSWNHPTRKSYCTPLIHQTLLYLTNVCYYWWVTHWWSTIFILMEIWRNGFMNAFSRNSIVFLVWCSWIAQKMGRHVFKKGKYFK